MSIQKKDGRYYITVERGFHDRYRCQDCGWSSWDRHPRCPDCGDSTLVDRRRRRDGGGGYDRKREAEDALARLRTTLRGGTYVAPQDLSVETWMMEWVEVADLADTTRENYRVQIRAYVLPHLGAVKLQDLSVLDLNRWHATLLREGGRNKTPLAPKTARNAAMLMRKALDAARRNGIVPRNVSDDATIPQKGRPTMKAWNREQLVRFLGSVADDRLFALVLLGATTGARRGELLGLAWSEVDLDHGNVTINQQLLPIGGVPTIVPGTKTGGGRHLAIDGWTVEALRDHRRRQLRERLAAGPAWVDTGLVFTREDGSPIPPQWFTKRLGKMQVDAGLPRIAIQGMRHTYATIALRLGEHPKIVSERLGHSSIKTTLDVYSHAVPEMQRESAERIAGLLRMAD